MSNELAVTSGTTRPSAMMALAMRVNVEPEKVTKALKDTVFKGATDSELLALVVVANEHHLNPFTREIYAFPKKGGGIVPIVGVDGWIRIVNNHPQFDGMTFDMAEDGSECSCTIHRKDRAHPITVTEYLSECKRGTEPWKDMPKRMLRNRALVQCARVAFGLSGIMDPDEGETVALKPAGDQVSKPLFTEPARSASEPEPDEPEPAEYEGDDSDLPFPEVEA